MVSLSSRLLFKSSRRSVRRCTCCTCLRGCYLRITEGKTALDMGGTKPLTWSPGVAKGKKLQDLLSQLLGST